MSDARSFAKLGATLVDLDPAWQDRLAGGEASLASGRYASAVVMGLYALEIRLKARICRQLDLPALPRPFEIHDLDGLLALSGLQRTLNFDPLARDVLINWNAAVAWAARLNGLRYGPAGVVGQPDASDFFSRLRDQPSGILPWIANQP